MTHKKKCVCGHVASGTTVKAVADGITEHCKYSGHEAIEAKNV
jgi:hypothetical protein